MIRETPFASCNPYFENQKFVIQPSKTSSPVFVIGKLNFKLQIACNGNLGHVVHITFCLGKFVKAEL
ncbi:hypothetical protein AQUCO_02600189v1 [Aquilegia coerulea]|uniref:Uncharacterized protein n=1 Tax=Aquilegia coerulea TaxID=218851 RepID=A0A2G5D7T1_AQUCA|nr:hypothetical protein AQUCO_02600189v1 [Aquilegia coerulea]